MRKINLLFIFLLSFCAVYAQNRSEREAMKIAEGYFSKHQTGKSKAMSEGVTLAATSDDIVAATATKSLSADKAFYVFNHGLSSFVIVSGDERMPEILGYSDSGAFVLENMPDNMRNWLSYYAGIYNDLGRNVYTNNVSESSKAEFADNVEPLLGDIMFDQVAPYNLLCPSYQGERTLAGCVATAIAEIMAYHKFPEKGIGSKSYTTQGDYKFDVSYDFENNPFDWENVLGTYIKGNSYKQEEVNAIKNLVFACGVAVEMDYDPEFSGASMVDALNGLVEHLGYDCNLHAVNRCNYLSTEWIDMMKNELNNNYPIFYTGVSKSAGHAFVIDGYDKNDLFHVNWGWNGMNNGYFELFSLSPQSTGSGGGADVAGYKYNQGMIVGFKPVKADRTDSYFEFSSLSFSGTEFGKGSSFEVSANKIYNWGYDFNGQVAVFIEKDGESTKIGETRTSSTLATGYGYNSLKISSVVPETVSDGEYSIVLKSQYEGSQKWCQSKGNLGTETDFILTVEGGNCKITPDASKVVSLECEMTLLHDLYYARLADADIKIKNNSSFSYYGNVGMAIFSKTGDTYDMVSYLKGEQFELAPGEEAVGRTSGYFAYNGTYLPAGKYYIAPAIISNPSSPYVYMLEEPVEISVVEPEGNAGIILGKPQVENTIVKIGEKINFSIDINTDTNGNVYQGYYTFAFFVQGENVHQLTSKSLVVGKDKTLHLVDSVDVSALAPGLYDMGFYVRRFNESRWSSSISCGKISVVPNPSGLDEEEVYVPYVLSTSSESNIRINANVGIDMVRVYSVSGQMLRSVNASGNYGEVVIPADNIRGGVYLIEVLTSDGNRYVLKTVRD